MIVALMFYDGDVVPSMSLARLIADIEPRYRDDVLLAFCSQPGTHRSGLVSHTVAHCSRRFPVVEVESELGAHGHPEGCTALWAGTTRYFQKAASTNFDRTTAVGRCKYLTTTWHSRSLLTLDANDVVPLHANWIELTLGLHSNTLRSNKLITGTPHFLGECPLHVNPNAVFEIDVFEKTKLNTDVPIYDGTLSTNFDIYHRGEMLEHAMLSSFVHTDWRGDGRKISLGLIAERARESVLLHGYKDPELYWTARTHLALSKDLQTPHFGIYYDLNDLRAHESVRRSFEESQR